MNINLAVKKEPLLVAKDSIPMLKPGEGTGVHQEGRRFGRACVLSCARVHRGEQRHRRCTPPRARTTSSSNLAKCWGFARLRNKQPGLSVSVFLLCRLGLEGFSPHGEGPWEAEQGRTARPGSEDGHVDGGGWEQARPRSIPARALSWRLFGRTQAGQELRRPGQALRVAGSGTPGVLSRRGAPSAGTRHEVVRLLARGRVYLHRWVYIWCIYAWPRH